MVKGKKRICIIILFLILLFVATGSIIFFQTRKGLYIDGEKISVEEYTFLESCAMPYVNSYQDNQYDEGTRKIILIRAEQEILQEGGIVTDYSYEKFLDELSEENERRKEQMDSNSVIYGPKQYSAKVYFDYSYSESRNQYMASILKEQLPEQEDEKVEQAYIEELLHKVTEMDIRFQ